MRHNVASLLRLMMVTDDRLVAGKRPATAGPCGRSEAGITALQVRLKEKTSRELVELVRALVAGAGRSRAGQRPPRHRHCRRGGWGASRARRPAGDIWPGPSVRRVSSSVHQWGLKPRPLPLPKPTTGAWAPGARPRPRETPGPRWAQRAFGGVVELARGKPCIAIGGIRPVDVGAVVSLGGAGVAVVWGILGAGDTEAAAREYRARFSV